MPLRLQRNPMEIGRKGVMREVHQYISSPADQAVPNSPDSVTIVGGNATSGAYQNYGIFSITQWSSFVLAPAPDPLPPSEF